MSKQTKNMKSQLLQNAIAVLLRDGIQGFTLQSVADHASISKGGLLHHFPNKRALIVGIYQEILEQFEIKIAQLIQHDPIQYGSFTRAYLQTILLDTETGVNSQLSALSIAVINDQELSSSWEKWVNGLQKKYAETDHDPMLQIIQLAADGIWFNYNLGTHSVFQNDQLIQTMLRQTYPE